MGSSVPPVLPKSPPSSSSDRYTIRAAYLCDDSPGLVAKSIESVTTMMIPQNGCGAVFEPVREEKAQDVPPRQEDGEVGGVLDGRSVSVLTVKASARPRTITREQENLLSFSCSFPAQKFNNGVRPTFLAVAKRNIKISSVDF